MDQIVKRPDTSVDRFRADAEQSWTMPARIYHDPDFLEDEKRAIFRRSWLFVGHVSDLRDPGDYITARFAGERVFVIRTASGDLKAFFNVCQHRGHSLLRGKGRAHRPIVCPYHAWAYDHDGTLIAARNCDAVEGFECGDFALPEIRVDSIGGFVFVNLDPEARPMAEVYAGTAEVLAAFCPGSEALTPDETIPFEIAGNWKNVGDNLLECYHCSTAHRAFVDLVKMDTYTVGLHDYWSVQHGECRPDNSAYEFGDDVANARFMTLYLWPGMAFAGFPGTGGVSVFSFVPTAPESTYQEFTYYRPGAAMTRTETAALAYFRDVLGPEDVDLVEDVQEGLRSAGYHQGRIMVDAARSEISEHALHHFQSLVMREMRDYL